MNNAAETTPQRATTTYQAKFPVTLKAGDYDLQTIIMDFTKGAVVPDHTHGGFVFGMVLNGEMTLKEEGGERVIRPERAGRGPWLCSLEPSIPALAADAGSWSAFSCRRGAEATTVVKP